MNSELYKTPFSVGDNVIYSKKGEITDIRVSNDADIYYVVKFGDRHSIVTTSNNLRMNNDSTDLENVSNQLKNMNMNYDKYLTNLTKTANKRFDLSTLGGKQKNKRNKSKKSRKSRKQGLH